MNLIVAATDKEITPFISASNNIRQNSTTLVTGAGSLEAALNLTRFLSTYKCKKISRIISVGVAGAFQKSGAHPLDICIAQKEIFADFGICYEERIENLDFPGCPENAIYMPEDGVRAINLFFDNQGIQYVNGTFLTVNCVSATGKRGDYLQRKYQAICENMEGFAVARVCQEFKIPCLEVRCVSNFVEDRNPQNWVIDAACEKLACSLTPFFQQ